MIGLLLLFVAAGLAGSFVLVILLLLAQDRRTRVDDELAELAELNWGVDDVPGWSNRRFDGSHPAVGKPERGAVTWTGPAIVGGLVAMVPVIGWAALVAVGSLGVALFAADQLREGT